MSLLNNHGFSREFAELIRQIGEARSKQEEDKIVAREVQTLKLHLKEKDITPKKRREYVMRAIYVEMLGTEFPQGHIHAVNLAQVKPLPEKKVGYVAACTLLHPDHELMIMMVNTLQRDLKSGNPQENNAALTTVCKLVNADIIPPLLPLVKELLEHPQAWIRKKAIMAIHRFYQVDASTVSYMVEEVKKALCDRDPSVMGASLHLLYDMVVDDPESWRSIVSTIVSILKQIIEHRLPPEYDYHRMPAPWYQMKILRILAVLGAENEEASRDMFETLQDVMTRADIPTNIGNAIVFECVRTITAIVPYTPLLESAASAIATFLSGERQDAGEKDSPNLRYVGIEALSHIAKVNPKYVVDHQITVIDCLEDPDETLKRRTLDLLFTMTTAKNVTVIVDKMVKVLKSTVDQYLKGDLVSKITSLTERFAPSNEWFIRIMNEVFVLGGAMVRPQVAHNLLRLIAEGTDDEEVDNELRQMAVESYLDILNKGSNLPDVMMQVIAWVIGEYAYVLGRDLQPIMDSLLDLLDRPMEDRETKGWIITALIKLSAQNPTGASEEVCEVIDKYETSRSVNLQQRVKEFRSLRNAAEVMRNVFPVDSSCDDLEVDADLSFLDALVQQALQAGARPYDRPDEDGDEGEEKSLRFDAYEMPTNEPHYAKTTSALFKSSGYGAEDGGESAEDMGSVPVPEADMSFSSLLGKKSSGGGGKWTDEGYEGAATVQEDPSAGASSLFSQPPPSFGRDKPADVLELEEKMKRAAEEKKKKQEGGKSSLLSPTNGDGDSMPWGATVSSRPRMPVSSRSQSRKEKMAAQLFGGGDGDEEVVPARGRGRGRPAERKTSKPVAKPVSSNAVDDLLGDVASAEKAPAPASSSLFGGMTAAPQPKASAPAGGGSLLDLGFGDESAASEPKPQARASRGASVDDLLGGFSTPDKPKQEHSTELGLGGLSLGGNSSAATLRDESLPGAMMMIYGDSPKAFEQFLPLESDAYIALGVNKIWTENEVVVLLAVQNGTDTPVNRVSVILDNPGEMKSALSGYPEGKIYDLDNTITFATVPSRSSAYVAITMKLNSLPQAGLDMSIVGKLSYVSMPDRTERKMNFHTKVDVRDILRPQEGMGTPSFGGLWPKTSGEVKISAKPTSIFDAKEVMTRLRSFCNVFPIQLIGIEGIAGAKMVGKDNNVLVHCKLQQGHSVDVTVRSGDRSLSNVVATFIAHQMR